MIKLDGDFTVSVSGALDDNVNGLTAFHVAAAGLDRLARLDVSQFFLYAVDVVIEADFAVLDRY